MSAGRTGTMRLLVFAAAAVSSAAVLVPASVASSEPGRGTRPAVLWNAFPLRVAPSTPPLAAPTRQGLVPPVRGHTPPAVVVRPPDSSGISPIVMAGIVLLLFAAAGAAFLVLRGPARHWDRAATAALSRGRAGAESLSALLSGRPSERDTSYVLLLPGRGGWGDRVVERDGVAPSLGEVIYDDELGRTGQAYVVKLVGDSPLPGDKRPCAVLRSL